MKPIIFYLAVLATVFGMASLQAQEQHIQEKIALLEQQKIQIQEEEREALKVAIEAINEKLDNGTLTPEEAETQKQQAAQKHALNIENRLAIINNTIALLQRGERTYTPNMDIEDSRNQIILRYRDGQYGFNILTEKNRKYDRRTYSDMVLAVGLNNALTEGQSLDDSPYSIGGSRFFELGWVWSTRIFTRTNAVRFRYGFSFQFNGLNPTENRYFVSNDNQTQLEVFPEDLNKAKLRIDNLVLPVHFEFGPSRKVEREDYFRYSTYKKFKFGIGGYAGLRLSTRQKLKYIQDGDRVKEKIKNNYNTNTFIYGLSTYIGAGDMSLYLKYDLNPIFNNAETDQRNISLGLRFDL